MMQYLDKRTAIFTITFFLGYLFRILTLGWSILIFGMPEYIIRGCYYFVGLTLCQQKMPVARRLNMGLQIFYLVTSFFSYDGDDKQTYTFAHLWINPPESLITFFWLFFAVITVFLIIFTAIYNIKNKLILSPMKKFIAILLGFLVVPALAIESGMLIIKHFNL